MLLKPNIRALRKNHYEMLGQIIATIICQGGQAPRIFTSSLVDYILTSDLTKVDADIDDMKRRDEGMQNKYRVPVGNGNGGK